MGYGDKRMSPWSRQVGAHVAFILKCRAPDCSIIGAGPNAARGVSLRFGSEHGRTLSNIDHLKRAVKRTPRSLWNGGYGRTPVVPEETRVGALPVLDAVETWIENPHLWTRRAALVFTPRWTKEKRDPERMLGWAARLAEDREWFI